MSLFVEESFRLSQGADLEAKRQQNLEDNRRFLAALKINDVSAPTLGFRRYLTVVCTRAASILPVRRLFIVEEM